MASVAPGVGLETPDARPAGRPRPLSLGLFVQAPAVALLWLAWFQTSGGGGDFAIFRRAGGAVFHGHSPYVSPTLHLLADNNRFVYPTPFAYPFVPFAALPERVGAIVFLGVSAGAILLAVRMLGVRDWRCFGAALIGAPAFGALGVGAIGPLLLLAVAAGWRHRDSAWSGALLATAAAAKLFLWPLLLWLLVTRRFRSALAASSTLAALLVVWWLADPSGLHRYPATVRVLNEAQRWKSYSPQTLVLSLGGGPRVAIAVSVGLAVVGGLAMWGLRRDERAAFACAILTALVASPISWLHYLVLLLVPIALYRPRLAPLWLAPLVLWVTPHPESLGSTWRLLLVLGFLGGCGVAIAVRRPHRAAAATSSG